MMRRALRKELPALRAVYGLSWADILDMPRAELAEHREQLAYWMRWAAGIHAGTKK
jgi:hypothetical protein